MNTIIVWQNYCPIIAFSFPLLRHSTNTVKARYSSGSFTLAA
ncbi:hypothetical protein MuYL_4779 [Mucilaginibacter xinganensis]|uniref:Uncharacterized protein n=1 Tax=Mucilaginibacter xinganensis TaxID=1234841 RepID=A0A223P3K3_9SPHI|nr:hypothetical protein MuYL_4779 [Mucilaginibacter xinganensis]